MSKVGHFIGQALSLGAAGTVGFFAGKGAAAGVGKALASAEGGAAKTVAEAFVKDGIGTYATEGGIALAAGIGAVLLFDHFEK